MTWRACLLVLSLTWSIGAHAAGAAQPPLEGLAPEQAAGDPAERARFPAPSAPAAPAHAASDRGTASEGMFEYPSGDASPICVTPTR